MYCDGDIIKVNEDYRLKVIVDNDTPSPLDDWRGCEILTIDDYRMWRGWEYPGDRVAYAAREFHMNARSGRWTVDMRDRAIRGYLHLVGDTREFEVYEWRGYSKSDWSTHLVLWDPETGANQSESWGAWRRGDVYGVIEETRTVYVNPEDPNDTYDDWSEGESIWGCYLTDEYHPRAVAEENFTNYPKED